MNTPTYVRGEVYIIGGICAVVILCLGGGWPTMGFLVLGILARRFYFWRAARALKKKDIDRLTSY